MEMITKLPAGNAIIGAREALKGVRNGKVKRIVVAKNCPEELISRIAASGTVTEMFNGDQQELAVRLGKPFPIAAAGFQK